jgi:3-phosphoglycerate kinase
MFGGGEEEVPGFATGGEVGSTGIAKVHAGETITPASKVPGSGGGSDMSQVVSVLNQILAKVNQPPVVNLDGSKISDNVNANNSYKNGNTT